MAEREYDSYQQGMLHEYSTRFFVAGIAILAMGFLITGLYIAS